MVSVTLSGARFGGARLLEGIPHVQATSAASCAASHDRSLRRRGGDDDGDSALGLVSSGTLTVCTDVPYPPMEFEDPDAEGGFTGFDIELMRAIADDLGLGLAVATPGWDAITSGLANEAGDCDISAASITITAEREENIDFSEPYFEGKQSLLVSDDSSASTLLISARLRSSPEPPVRSGFRTTRLTVSRSLRSTTSVRCTWRSTRRR